MNKLLTLLLASLCILYSCKKENTKQDNNVEEKITNENNQFGNLEEPVFSIISKNGKIMSTTTSNSNTTGCITTLHTQSQTFEKLNVLDPTSDILYVGSLLDGNSIQTGLYTPVFLSSDYVRKPITFSVSIQGATGPISKTITPQLSSFRTAMQEITNSTIVGEQAAAFTFQVVKVRSKKEVEMIAGANLNFGSFFTAAGNYNENSVSDKSYYLLKMFQKFFTADIDIPQDGNLFNKPIDYGSNIAPVYVSSIDYGRSAFLMIESSYDSVRIKKALEVTFNAWKVNGGANISKEHKDVTEEMTISGSAIGGSSSLAAATISGLQGFHDYIVNSGNLTTNSRGAIIAYRLRNAKNHGIYQTLINGDYYTKDCSSQIVPITAAVKGAGGVNFLTLSGIIPSGFRATGTPFKAYKTQVNGSVPIHEFVGFYKSSDWSPYSYLYSTNTSQHSFWKQYSGVAFYAFDKHVTGTIPIYCWVNSIGRDHLFSPGPMSDPYWINSGVAFYAFPKD